MLSVILLRTQNRCEVIVKRLPFELEGGVSPCSLEDVLLVAVCEAISAVYGSLLV